MPEYIFSISKFFMSFITYNILIDILVDIFKFNYYSFFYNYIMFFVRRTEVKTDYYFNTISINPMSITINYYVCRKFTLMYKMTYCYSIIFYFRCVNYVFQHLCHYYEMLHFKHLRYKMFQDATFSSNINFSYTTKRLEKSELQHTTHFNPILIFYVYYLLFSHYKKYMILFYI